MNRPLPHLVRIGSLTVIALVIMGVATSSAFAFHPWGSYHWAKSGSAFPTTPTSLKLGDNVSGNNAEAGWDGMLRTTSNDWSLPSYNGTNWLGEKRPDGSSMTTVENPVRTEVVAGTTSAKRCAAKSGRVEVCSERYGRNGWLGIAQIWASGSHITQAIAKMNDTYLGASAYAMYRMPVMCQEVGHAFGLGHQGENDVPWNTCMDYAEPGPHSNAPNFHDYNQLRMIYEHGDASTTIDTSTTTLATKGGSAPYRTDRHDAHGESTIVEHYADNSRKITHIRWVPGAHAGRGHTAGGHHAE